MPKTHKSLTERFWNKVKKTKGCWFWTGAILQVTGYGCFAANPNKLAHRAAWEFINGAIPNGLCVLHRCDNRRCVNPDHLFLGTHQDNSDDMFKKGRNRQPKGEKSHRALLSNAQVRKIKKLYFPQKLGYRKLAKMFGVHFVTIGDIIRGTTWSHIS